ncbi:helix-turn-helix domain-containing protein [Actinoplanes sp. NPDC026623]|uniref:helix-turn-helix domain-containing protein n=1 Tax=Actinoplanes sp. NPDC026623 TaxID=3155610 RepID=UPI00340F91A4
MSVRESPELMLTVKEAAAQLKLSPSYAKKLIASGELPSVKVGRCRRVRTTDLGAYVDGLTCDIAPNRAGRPTGSVEAA